MCLLRKASLAFFLLALCYPKGHGSSGLPLALWALLMFWLSPELETNSKRVLLRGEGGFAWKGLVCTGPSHPPRGRYGGTQLGPISETAEISLLGAAFCKGKLCSGSTPQSQFVFAQESNACLFLTSPCANPRAKEALGCLWLRGHCCFAGGLVSLKPTPNEFSFWEKADWA